MNLSDMSNLTPLDDAPDENLPPGDLAAAITLLAQTLAAPKPMSVPTTKLRELDTFDRADPNKLRTFILQCSLHFRDRTNAFASNRAKVAYALSFLTGPALGWFEPMLFDPDEEPPWLSDWPLFQNELSANFKSFDPVGEAEAEIEGLRMPKNSWVTLYFVEFNRLAACLQWGDSALLQQAYKGLAWRVKNEMVHHEKPTSLPALRKLVQSIDSRYWERKAEVARETHQPMGKHDSRTDPKSDQRTGKTTEPQPKARGNPTEAAKMGPDLTGKLGKDGKLTPAEQQCRMENNLCLFCGNTGHLAKDCSKVPSTVKARATTTAPEPATIAEVKAEND